MWQAFVELHQRNAFAAWTDTLQNSVAVIRAPAGTGTCMALNGVTYACAADVRLVRIRTVGGVGVDKTKDRK
jgi:hypothetical protein